MLYSWHFVCHVKPVVPIEDTQPRDEEAYSSFCNKSVVYMYDTQPRDEETHYTPLFWQQVQYTSYCIEATSTFNIRDGPPIPMQPCGSGGRGGGEK